MSGQSLRSLSPIRVVIGTEDVTGYLSDGGCSFSNTDPGGFEAFSAQFPKDMESTIRGLPIRVDSGLGVAWEGRVSQVQRSLGHNTMVTGEGYAALLKDTQGSMVFVDRDLTRWGSPSVARQQQLVTGNYQLGVSQVAADPTSNSPSVAQSITDSWVSPFKPICEAYYDAGPGNLIARVYASLSGGGVIGGGGSWYQAIMLSSDADQTTTETTGNVNAGGVVDWTPPTQYRFAVLQDIYNATPAGQQGAVDNVYWALVAVYGNHGLTKRGSAPEGFYPSDIVSWALSQVTGLQAGVIQQTDSSGYIVPHSAYYLPVTLDTMVTDMATVQGWHWGVWPSLSPLTGDSRPRLDFRPRPAPGAFTASCRRQDCSTLDIREDLAQQYNQAVITWTNVDGTQGAVTVTADNPVLDAAGITSKTLTLNGGTMTPATAALYGAEALALTNIQQKVAGTAEIIAPIDTGVGYAPAWMLKAGIDRLRVIDMPSTDAWGSQSDYPITRVECSLSSGGFTTNVELGTGAQLVETLAARLSAATSLSAQG